MKQELTVAKITPNEELSTEKSVVIVTAFMPYCIEMQELEDEYDEITHKAAQGITPKLVKQAKALKSKYVSLRASKGAEGVKTYLKRDNIIEAREIDNAFGTIRDAAKFREDPLTQIIKHAEIEQAAREAELQEERAKILLDYGVTEPNPELGLMEEEFWETYFEGIRKEFKAEQERIVKEALRIKRITEISKYSLFIKDYDATVWENLKEKRFQEILEEGKAKFEAQQKAVIEAKEIEERVRKEEEAKAAKFRNRVNQLTGTTLKETGIFYEGKMLMTVKSLESATDADYGKLLSEHLKTYKEDLETKRIQEIEKQEALKEREQVRLKLAAERAVVEAEQKRVKEETAKEEKRLLALKQAEIDRMKSPDADKLREYADAWYALELPSCVTPEGVLVEEKLRGMIERGTEWVNNAADNLK